MRGSTVPSLPLQSVFPGWTHLKMDAIQAVDKSVSVEKDDTILSLFSGEIIKSFFGGFDDLFSRVLLPSIWLQHMNTQPYDTHNDYILHNITQHNDIQHNNKSNVMLILMPHNTDC
jgi:hypothetical protein